MDETERAAPVESTALPAASCRVSVTVACEGLGTRDRFAVSVSLLVLLSGLLPSYLRWPGFGVRPAFAEGFLPSRCEGRAGDLYETRGPASLEKLGDRYVLTVRCDGVHQIYVRGAPGVQLEPFLGKPVRARYRYVEEVNPQTRCVRAPCPPGTERLLEIAAIEVVAEQ